MPYLTPQELPEGDDCRPLSIPADSEWLALFGGALTELTKSWNWEYSGGLTVDETVAKMTEIIDDWYTVACGGCELPEGGKIIRIGEHGVIEQLGDSGSWVSPTGDYVIPPPDARTGGTPQDQMCLAAKNATNVLQQLYENLSESWASHLSEAEAGTEFIIAAVALIGFEFAPITFAIVAFFEVIFAALYTALEYLGADLWDSAFTDQMVCFLYECASNDDGVVTFDWDCLMAKLNSLTDNFGLTEIQIRLYLQVTYILYFIGGIDGLNLAATTTAITSGSCDYCSPWCYEWDFTVSDGGWQARTGFGITVGHYTSGTGWQPDIHNDGCSNHGYTYLYLAFPEASNISRVEYEFSSAEGSFDIIFFDQNVSAHTIVQRTSLDNGVATVHQADMTPVTCDVIEITINKCGTTGWTQTKCRVFGDGTMPAFEGGDLCP